MRTGIALGSNLGDRLALLRNARDRVVALDAVSPPILQSPVYETDPVDSTPGTPAYLNAVLEVELAGQPAALLASLQDIERELGRPSRHPRNAPRTVDLDVLYAGDLIFSEGDLVIPHPRLGLRRFVLAPLNDLRPDLVLPGYDQPVARLLDRLPAKPGARRWKEDW